MRHTLTTYGPRGTKKLRFGFLSESQAPPVGLKNCFFLKNKKKKNRFFVHWFFFTRFFANFGLISIVQHFPLNILLVSPRHCSDHELLSSSPLSHPIRHFRRHGNPPPGQRNNYSTQRNNH
uniref:Uncharacterized protein n=1 Tax=Cacopsylla melanoneura TaxID=428564 RepID=A0A8D8XA55_9HEMI